MTINHQIITVVAYESFIGNIVNIALNQQQSFTQLVYQLSAYHGYQITTILKSGKSSIIFLSTINTLSAKGKQSFNAKKIQSINPIYTD